LKILIFLCYVAAAFTVELGTDQFAEQILNLGLKGKSIGLVTNHTGVSSKGVSTISLLEKNSDIKLAALFSPEHGLAGVEVAGKKIEGAKKDKLMVHSLHGDHRRPTDAMLKGLDAIVFDIQDVGVRGYTYISTLFYVMEAAAKKGILVIVLDRPNPMGGSVVNGTMLDPKWRSFIGYINVPYCHGMTIGELATFFNSEYEIGCKLSVVKMKGWKRSMTFRETALHWIPTSPNVPEADTPYFQAATGILGELGLVNIGVGYTLPFKVIGAPWIDGKKLADHLNNQKLKGVHFAPFSYKPFFGLYAKEECSGVLLQITDHASFMPVDVQFLILGALKSLYPKKVSAILKGVSKEKRDLFCKAVGNDTVLKLLESEETIAWKLIDMSQSESKGFVQKRQKYLFQEYQ
jgi:uncharacterized protein YbbC (DUF1343 family)